MTAVTFDTRQVQATRAAFRSYARDIERTVQQAAGRWTVPTAAAAATAARSVGGSARLVAPTIRGHPGARASITAGGAGRSGAVAMGSEYGGRARRTTRQFRPYRPAGYFLGPTVKRRDPQLTADVNRALAAAAGRWSRGG